MPKFFVTENQVENDAIYIIGKDVNHIKNVLRKNINDNITICNNDSKQDYLCKIININEEKIQCEIVEKLQTNTESNILINVCQGLPKADKMELIIQKAVELGVYEITPIKMKRCVVKLKGKDEEKKIERWQKISEVASKQCGRNHIPQINKIKLISEVCEEIKNYDLVLIAYECEEQNTLKKELEKIKEKVKENSKEELKILILIGPEGGIDEQEIDLLRKNGAKIITLGKRILRTETVALSMTSIIMYELEN